MTDIIKKYEEWLDEKSFDRDTVNELKAVKDDINEITERFYKHLEFGTGGLRGIIGAGINRMNVYTVALATEAFARYINDSEPQNKSKCVAISYDSRRHSEKFALVTALVFANHGIKAYLSDELRPTPMLSFAVRHFKASGGVMITASHNPAEYNGYKVYGSDGGQITPETANKIVEYKKGIDDIRSVKPMDRKEAENKGLLEFFGVKIDEIYSQMLQKIAINKDAIKKNKDMKIVFTPLHGASNKPVRRILDDLGFENVLVVPEQEKPDPGFPTVKSPNPEEKSALEMGISLAKEKSAQIVLATDPDGDRVGVALKCNDGSYEVLTGNQIGILLLEYILGAKKEEGTLSDKSFAVTTIVSTRMARMIAEHYKIKLFEVLTGFKYIGEVIKKHDENGQMNFEFGFEESYGYLAGTQVRDKDATVAVMLIAEMTAAAMHEEKNLYDKLKEIYERYGYASEKTVSITLEGKTGNERISNAMNSLRTKTDESINGIEIESVSDYLNSKKTDYKTKTLSVLDLDKSDVLLYDLGDNDWFCVRPSGTEPKIKIYFGFYGPEKEDCENKLGYVSEKIISYIKNIL